MHRGPEAARSGDRGSPYVSPPLPAPPDWRAIRRRFLIPEGYAYCNTGTVGACPREVVEATVSSLRDLEERLVTYDYDLRNFEMPVTGYDKANRHRDKIAAFVGASRDEIALTQNATVAMSLVANGLELAAGDEILTTDQEHPGGLCPWQSAAARRGAVVKTIPIRASMAPEAVVQAFADAISPRTRVLWTSDVTSGLGLVLPAKELCRLARDRGVFSVMDGAQTVGQLRVDLHDLGCDAYVASPHKWLCAPKGCGFLYVRAEALDRIWTTLAGGRWSDREWMAARLQQYGTGNLSLLRGLDAAIDLQSSIGLDAIEARDRALTERLRAGLVEMPRVRVASSLRPDMSAAITAFRVEGKTPKEVQDLLWEARVRVRIVAEADAVRCGTHYYVLEEDVDRILEVIGGIR